MQNKNIEYDPIRILRKQRGMREDVQIELGKYCMSCGVNNPKDAEFCMGCGRRFKK